MLPETNSAGQIRGIALLLRPHHWIKNTFVLAPLLFSGKFLDITSVVNALLATVLFCAGASAVYVLNDLFDCASDRQHPIKRLSRPIASGSVSAPSAVVVLLCLYAVVAVGWWILASASAIITVYILLNIAYSLRLKHIPIIDLFVIASGFVLRLYAGAFSIDAPLSAWMLVTTFSMALYLAAIKRRQELHWHGTNGRKSLELYSEKLIERYANVSSTGALIFYSLFVLTSKPALIATLPIVIFGFFRYWYLVEQKGAGESPTDTIVRDKPMIATILLWTAVCLLALWPLP